MSAWILKWVLLVALLHNYSSYTSSQIIKEIGGYWTVRNLEKDFSFLGRVPGGIYSDLMRNEKIEDVFYGYNDVETRWVSKLDWNYSRIVTVIERLLNYENINLVLDGVDTFSTILVNNVEVGKTENMFVRYIFDIKSLLKVGSNQIDVQFKSPVNTAKAIFDEQAKHYEVVPLCVPEEYNGECHVNHIRKMQASFSWDWGPALPSVGIWKKVYIEAFNSAVIRDVTVKMSTTPESDSWNVQFGIYLAPNTKGTSIKGKIEIMVQTNSELVQFVDNQITVDKNTNGDYLKTVDIKIRKSYVDLWWPNGYGEPQLYSAVVAYASTDKTEKSEKTLRLGFRTAELVQEEIESGRKFYFKVNDVPIYAKGSNSIPINILPELGQDRKAISFLLQSATDVNMNMLRVWGGGSYEADIFYGIADELGILIWQDFMFACSMYPATDKFLDNVRSEVRHQVRRLQHHPSIILWAGNNENEAALRQDWYGTGSNFSQFHADYRKLYVETIEKELQLSDDTRPYLTSSPTNGIKSIEEDYVASEPQSNFFGDVHFYNYFKDGWKPDTYPINRFASEYGYQALPSISTLSSATNDTEDLSIQSEFLNHRQHLPGGFEKMDLLMQYRLELPTTIEDYVYYSQIIQAMAVKIETEYNRQWRSVMTEEGKGYTMGALYWQLNDVWVAPTWSGIDFKNNWKMMHYYARHFFAPVIVTGALSSDGTLDIYIVSDLLQDIPKAILTISVYKWDSLIPVNNSTIETAITNSSSFLLKSFAVEKYLSDIPDNPCGSNGTENCFFYFTLKDDKGQKVAPENYVFPTPLKSANLPTANIQITGVSRTNYDPFTISIKTNATALFVWIEAEGIRGQFSDNGFQQVSELHTVQFTPENVNLTAMQLEQALSVKYLNLKPYQNQGNGQTSINKQYLNCFVYLMIALLLRFVHP